jgi:hypothetical protein
VEKQTLSMVRKKTSLEIEATRMDSKLVKIYEFIMKTNCIFIQEHFNEKIQAFFMVLCNGTSEMNNEKYTQHT